MEAEAGAARSSIPGCVPGDRQRLGAISACWVCFPAAGVNAPVWKQTGEGRCHGVRHSSEPALPSRQCTMLLLVPRRHAGHLHPSPASMGHGYGPAGLGSPHGLAQRDSGCPPGPTSHIHRTSLNLKAKLKLAFPSEQHLLFCHSPLWLTRSLLAAPGSCATKINSDESQETQGGSRGLQRWGRDNLVTILPIRIVLLRGQRGVWHLWESRNELSSAQ